MTFDQFVLINQNIREKQLLSVTAFNYSNKVTFTSLFIIVIGVEMHMCGISALK